MTRLRTGALALAVTFAPAALAADLIEMTSPHPVTETVERLTAAVEKAGAKVAATIDHQANAKSVGTDIPPTTLVMFGNPKVGTPLIAAGRTVALDLPVRVLVFEADGQTRMVATAPETLAERHGLEGTGEAVRTMRGAIEKLMGAAAAQ